jgi:hypothetical protein
MHCKVVELIMIRATPCVDVGLGGFRTCEPSDFASNFVDGLAESLIRASRLRRLLRADLLELHFTAAR